MEPYSLDLIPEYIQDLENKKQEYYKKGYLTKVEDSVQKIEHLKAFMQIYESMKKAEQFEAEMSQLELDQQLQLQEFDYAWEDLYKIEEDRIKDAEQTIFQLHLQEMEELQNQLQSTIHPKVKFSPDILQKQTLYNQLIKAGHFAQADVQQKQLYELMKSEQYKWEQKQQDKMQNKLNVLTKKQINELQALQQKLKSQIQDFIITRDQQKQLLTSKLQIIKNELEAKHNAEYTKDNKLNNKLLVKLQQFTQL